MKANRYICHSATEATDRANLYYIASPSATGIEKDGQRKQITVTSRTGRTLATFSY